MIALRHLGVWLINSLPFSFFWSFSFSFLQDICHQSILETSFPQSVKELYEKNKTLFEKYESTFYLALGLFGLLLFFSLPSDFSGYLSGWRPSSSISLLVTTQCSDTSVVASRSRLTFWLYIGTICLCILFLSSYPIETNGIKMAGWMEPSSTWSKTFKDSIRFSPKRRAEFAHRPLQILEKWGAERNHNYL